MSNLDLDYNELEHSSPQLSMMELLFALPKAYLRKRDIQEKYLS